MKSINYLLFITSIVYISILISPMTLSGNITKDGNVQYKNSGELPVGYNDLFAGSGKCKLCHNSQVNALGESVAIINDWRSSMMANASKDPFWRAKVSHETLINPDHAQFLEDVCTKCHAPLGHFNAHYNGLEYYAVEQIESDPLAYDGVNCTICHQITPESLGNYSGELMIGENKIIWGPFSNPFVTPMINNTGYTPTHSDHVTNSKLCGSCHTLLTPTIDYQGNLTGTYFPEQAIYHEWLNSEFSQNNINCQACHMPRIDDVVQVSSLPPWLGGRTPFAKHHLAGANVFMLQLLKENLDTLGITATEEQMDSTINRARRMLQQASLLIQLEEKQRTEDTLYLELMIENLAGHKFPTGYPSRRAFVELLVTAQNNDTIFHSGKMDNLYNLIAEDEEFEPHYNTIIDEDQVQIYEMVMGDVNLEPTTVLAYAYQHLKDNRIPPAGFTSAHYTWDTVAVTGAALSDEDFNSANGIEGSGSDNLHFHVPTNGNEGMLNITAKIHYQTVSGKWLENMFEYTSDEINLFESMFDQANKEPVIVAENSIISLAIGIENLAFENAISIYPNPGTGRFNIAGGSVMDEIKVYDNLGKLIETYFPRETSQVHQSSFSISVSGQPGMYYFEIHQGRSINVAKVLLKGR